jgi:integrase
MSKKSAIIFTTTWLNSLIKRKPPSTSKDYREINRTGFGLRHTAGGELVFRFRYMRNKKVRVVTIGWYPAMTLDEAHEVHSELRRWYKRGLDPRDEQERCAKQSAREKLALDAVAGVTIRNLIAEWAWWWARPNRKRPREAVRLLKVHLLTPALLGKPANEIAKRDLVLIIDEILKRGSRVMANRMTALICQVFRVAAKRDLIQNDPASGLMEKPGGAEHSRNRYLTEEEVRTFWLTLPKPTLDEHDKRKHALGEPAISYPLRLALKLILITGQRPGEVAGARCDEFNLNERLWTIPPERIKTVRKTEEENEEREHYVPLTDLAVEIIGELLLLAKGRPFLVPNKHSKKKCHLPVAEKSLARALNNCRVKSANGKGMTLFGMRPFVPNDLRRTAATHMGRLGVTRFDQNRVLNHVDSTEGGKYDRWSYWPQKLKALNAWSEELLNIVNDTHPKVVSINQPRRVSRVAGN